MSSVALKGYLHIFILVYHLQHSYNFWTMLSHSCIWMNVGRIPPPRLTVGPFVLKLKGALHHINMGDKWIIDNSNAFLFIIWLDELRRTYWARTLSIQQWAFYCKLRDACLTCTSGWLGNSMKVDDRIYLKGMFQLEASLWLIDNLDGCWQDAHKQSEDNSQKNPGEKILHDESSNTTLGGRVKLDKQRE